MLCHNKILRFAVFFFIAIFISCNGIVLAQSKVICKQGKIFLPYTIDSTSVKETSICFGETVLSIPRQYYINADSIIVRLFDYNIPDRKDRVHTSYCYPVGKYYLALYLDPLLFPVKNDHGMFYFIDLYFKDKTWYNCVEK